MFREVITVKNVSFFIRTFIFFIKSLKSNKKKLFYYVLCFIISVEKDGWTIQKSLFACTNKDSSFSHTRDNSKMFNITSKYISFFNNKPPAS